MRRIVDKTNLTGPRYTKLKSHSEEDLSALVSETVAKSSFGKPGQRTPTSYPYVDFQQSGYKQKRNVVPNLKGKGNNSSSEEDSDEETVNESENASEQPQQLFETKEEESVRTISSSNKRISRKVKKRMVEEDQSKLLQFSGKKMRKKRWKGRVAAYCLAASYNIKGLFSYLKEQFRPTIYRDTIHIQYVQQVFPDGDQDQISDSVADIFFFPYGCVVCWGMSVTKEQELLRKVKDFAEDLVQNIEYDDNDFSYGPETTVVNDEFILGDNQVITKLAFSHGIAQSTKLSIFEDNIERLIEETKVLPEELSKKGKISLSRKEIAKLMGALFIQKNSVNLHSDILDVPDFFWDFSELEKIYHKTIKHFDLKQRVTILNTRLEIVQELFDMLKSELQSSHETFLELIVIFLIVAEVVLEMGTMLVEYLQQ